MHLFLNIVTNPGTFILFQNREIIAEESWIKQGSEFDFLLESIEIFCKNNHVSISALEGVVVVRGPGWFTSTRIVSLIANTWQSLFHIPLQSITLFDLFLGSGGRYPLCVKANRGEYLVWSSAEVAPEILPLDVVAPGEYFWVGDSADFPAKSITIHSNIDYPAFFSRFVFEPGQWRVEPYYIKKPNIT